MNKLLIVLLLCLTFFVVTSEAKEIMETSSKSSGTPVTVSIRYIVSDIDAAVAFYRDVLGFKVLINSSPGFAQLAYGNLQLLLNKPGAGGAGQAMQDGAVPQPGGWNRFQLTVANLESFIEQLKAKGAKFRNQLVNGNGGKQILLEDPSGNLIELFEPKDR